MKTKLMVAQRDRLCSGTNNLPRRDIYDVFVQILDKEGPSGLFVGLRSRVLLCTFGGLIYFFVSDVVLGSKF